MLVFRLVRLDSNLSSLAIIGVRLTWVVASTSTGACTGGVWTVWEEGAEEGKEIVAPKEVATPVISPCTIGDQLTPPKTEEGWGDWGSVLIARARSLKPSFNWEKQY